MRPVRLDLHGFASFREPTVVDWDQVDYFALVGPTGSGKSTVIDAIVFALYGTVPRWGKRNAVRDALAPTSNRATVRLVFDVAGRRYAVAREVRRVGQNPAQKTTSLERLLDPNDLSGPSQVIAADPAGISAEVERLIGLRYEDFIQCVVLPQGQFADFLKATNATRQDILLKLLGADRYDQIRKVAAERANLAKGEVETLTGQVDALADATAESITAAEHRVRELDAGAVSLADLAGHWQAARQQLEAAEHDLRQAQEQALTVDTLRVPDQLPEICAAATRTAADQAAAAERVVQARQAHQQARTRLAQAEDRTSLTNRRDQWQTLSRVRAEQPQARQAVDQAETVAKAAEGRLGEATAAAEAGRQAWQQAAEHLQQVENQIANLAERQTRLGQVQVPDNLTTVCDRLRAAQQRRDMAAAAADQAVAAEEAAEHAVELAPDPQRLRRAVDLAREIVTVDDELTAARERSQTAEQTRARAEQLQQQTQQDLEQAELALEQARTANRAAAVRAELRVGCACPVCGNQVVALPEPIADDRLGTASEARDQARTTLDEASSLLAEASSKADQAKTAQQQVEWQRRQMGEEWARLAGDDHQDGLQDRLRQAEEAEQQAKQARVETRQTRADLAEAEQVLQAAQRDQSQLQSSLQQALRQLLPLGLVPADSNDLAEQWQQLRQWQTTCLDLTGAELAASEHDRDSADAVARAAQHRLDEFTAAQDQAQQALTDAQITIARARDRFDQLGQQQTDLQQALADAPSLADTEQALAERDRWEQDEQDRYREAESAAAEAKRCDDAHRLAAARLGQSRDYLYDQVQSVASLSPPPITTDDLVAGWATLTEWAARRRADLRDTVLPEHERRVTTAQASLETVQSALAQLADQLGLATESRDPHRLELELTRAQARAENQRNILVDRAEQRRQLHQQVQQAEQQRQVAATLAGQLQANKFQGWLAAAALDSLVDGASVTLRELSGGQFDLTHEKGEFHIIDHADADSLRSVRTLSGGETFQTSLALALALSDQLSSLQTMAAAPLESIFLDEGFGSLDADSLDIVAATLEKLAASERMVGIVTHVSALAERVPVRYQVSRDTHGSRVAREEDR